MVFYLFLLSVQGLLATIVALQQILANCAIPSHIDLSKDDDDCLGAPIQSVEDIQDATKDTTT